MNTQKKTDAEALIFMFRGLKFHVWEYHDGVWGGRDQYL